MNKECNLITPENIQGELINSEMEQINLRVQAFKEQKYNELLKENKDLQKRIDKAIEYIKECNKKEGLAMYVDTWQHLLPLLNILGGDVDDE